jgi:hypothetical protein
LEYKDIKVALQDHVKEKHKKDLRTLSNELGGVLPPNSLGSNNLKNLTYHSGKAVYISEGGVLDLVSASKLPKACHLKLFFDQLFYNMRYKSNFCDIFSFIKTRKLNIDVTSPWFQDLWFPLSRKQGSVGTTLVLTWLGYEGAYKIQQQNFKRMLTNNKIPFEEIDYTDKRFIDHDVMKREISETGSNNLKHKRWIVLDVRNFKKAVLRLNTKNAEIVRDYYLNLEEACFEYAEYQAEWIRNKSERERQILLQQLELEKVAKEKAEREKEFEKVAKEKAEREKEFEKIAKEKAERKALRINKFMKQITVKEHKLEWIYIATTSMYASERIFKIGSTTRLSTRIGGYNTGRPVEDGYYYCWVVKCYNAKDVDYCIQKLLVDFKHRKTAELYCGIRFTDLRDIVAFIVKNYDASVDYINNFIKFKLSQSLDEEDLEPPRLDCKRITYHIGEHTETINLENEDLDTLELIKLEISSMLTDMQQRQVDLVVDRKMLLERLEKKISSEPRKNLWTRVKEFTGWTTSKAELTNGDLNYKIVY